MSQLSDSDAARSEDHPHEGDVEQLTDEHDDGSEEDEDLDIPPLFEGFRNWWSSGDSRGFRYGLATVIGCIILLWLIDSLEHAYGLRIMKAIEPRGRWLEKHFQLKYGIALGAFVVILFVYRLRYRHQVRRGIKPLPWLLISFAVLVVFGISTGAVWLLFREASKAPDATRAGLRFDAVKTAITLFAGTTGAGVLILSLRSHFTSETDRLNNQFDAAAQKLTDDSPVIQTAGLLALERIAKKHPAYQMATREILKTYIEEESYNSKSIQLAHRIWARI